MWRYLKEAFWARPDLFGLGRIPWNAIAVGGVTLLGFGEPAIWLAGAGLETLYLFTLASNARFQKVIDAQYRTPIAPSEPASPPKLDGSSRERHAAVEEKRQRVEGLYRDSSEYDFLYDSNREALQKLSDIFLKLLVAKQNLIKHGSANEADLRQRITTIERELAAGAQSESLRESREATLAILRQRLRNLQRREETLAEIESDLTRIEAQFDLAIEDATLKGKPSAISSNIDLVSHLLDDALLDTSTTTSASREMEN